MADADGRRLNGGRGLGAALAADFDPWAAVGGVRGLVETTVPGIIFLVVYTVTKDVGLSVVAPLGVALGCLAVRLAQRIDVLPVLGGLLGIAASALWAWRTGRASDYFTLGLMTNAAYLAGLLLSLAVRWPALGLLIGFARGDATGWRSGGSDDRRATRRRYAVITWMWAGLFAARLAVQTPLYYTDATEALAVVRLIMGPPVYALLAWFTWLLVRGLPPVPARRAAGRDRQDPLHRLPPAPALPPVGVTTHRQVGQARPLRDVVVRQARLHQRGDVLGHPDGRHHRGQDRPQARRVELAAPPVGPRARPAPAPVQMRPVVGAVLVVHPRVDARTRLARHGFVRRAHRPSPP